LLDSMSAPEQMLKPITADDIIDPLDEMAAENIALTDPDDIDSLLGDIQGNATETKEDENKALIDNFTNEYVAPFLSVDFSELLKDDTEVLVDDTHASHDESINEKISKKDNDLSDNLDIDALLAEMADGDNLNSDDLDIGDDILIDGQVNELEPEAATDYTDSDVLADLLADENISDDYFVDENSENSENSEIDEIDALAHVDFDDLLANIAEESQTTPSDDLDFSTDFNANDIDLDAVDSDDEIKIEVDTEDDFDIDLDDVLDIGDDLNSDNNLNVDFEDEDEDEDDFVSVDSLLSDSLSDTEDEEPYNKTDFNVGLNEFPEFSGENAAEEEDDNGIAAKLDLAKVYIEIGDNENAEVILQDVVAKGDAQQQFDAQQLLDNIS
jgi:pilus assembly protein FimV